MRKALLIAGLLLLPRVLYAADGDLAGTCVTKGLWRQCQVKLCDAVNFASVAQCSEFDLTTLERGAPDVLVVTIEADNCTTPTKFDLIGHAIAGGLDHVEADAMATNAVGSYTRPGGGFWGYRYIQVKRDTAGSVGTCDSQTVYGTAWYRLP